MAKKTSKNSDVAEQANTALAYRLRDLVKNTNALAIELDCTLQAVNQYKQGISQPKIENLIKISKFYNVSIDYLLGVTDIPNRDTEVQAVGEFTGLSPKALQNIVNIKKAYSENQFYNMFFENENILILFEYIQDYICEANEKEKDFKLFKAEKIFRDILNTLTSE